MKLTFSLTGNARHLQAEAAIKIRRCTRGASRYQYTGCKNRITCFSIQYLAADGHLGRSCQGYQTERQAKSPEKVAHLTHVVM